MRVFVDTSALYALLNEDDAHHADARGTFASLQGMELVTHAYVVVETVALVSRRLGWDAVLRLLDGLLAVVSVAPVDGTVHEAALAAFRDSGSASISFVDRASFAFMRANRLADAFAFDSDFAAAGFDLLS
jgi:predicted nucleic acid-binding protein